MTDEQFTKITDKLDEILHAIRMRDPGSTLGSIETEMAEIKSDLEDLTELVKKE